jgi:prepilin-type N-terminal cleavage/methylation domain-containing protein
MKRAGFTMIELIFVIVILGILSAVALPKFIGVSDQARAGKCEAFIGTLNRTIGPSMWSSSLAVGGNGGVTDANTTLGDYITLTDIPIECFKETSRPTTDAAMKTLIMNTSGITGIAFGNSTYDVNFTDGNLSESPRWTWAKN